MSKKANPKVIGGFVVGAVALVVAGVLVFGGGKFLRETKQWVLYFDESIKGLAIGAPVTFKGVKVGSVTDIRVVVDREKMTVRTPVFIEIEAHRFTDAAGGEFKFEKGTPGAKHLIEQGLRAQLEMQSFVTGQLAVALDFHPDEPVKLSGVKDEVPEFPTIPSTGEELTKTIEELPVKELAAAALNLLQDIDKRVRSPEVTKGIRTLNEALSEIKELVDNIDRQITPAAHDVLRGVQELVGNVDEQVTPAARDALRGVGELARDIDEQVTPAARDTLRDVGKLARDVDDRVTPAARDALKQAEATLATAEGAIGERSELRYQLTSMLAELRAAARSIRVLADFLERHPEALLAGKGGPGGNRR